MQTPLELETFTFTHMPEAFFRRLFQGVFTAHRTAVEMGRQEFAPSEQINIIGFNRRAKFEGYMRDVAAMYPEMDVKVVMPDGSNWNHTEIRSGPVVLTASSVQTPCALVKKADFRQTLAESSQLSLFVEESETPVVAESLYVLLLHSKSQWPTSDDERSYGHLPGSAYLAFPSPDLNGYIHRINLFERFPEVVESQLPQDLPQSARLQYVRRAAWTKMA